jgi:LysR family transcriptional regulator for bpeEF and oprC
MDTFRAMHAFVGVVDTGGFTSAAELLKMPKATLSACVAELESHLKVRLLHRTTRKVTVTPDGAAYYERCVRILEDLRDAEESLSSRHASASGKLRVDVSTAVASRLLIPLLHTFLERYPDIELELGCSDRPLNLLSEGIDCALRVGEVQDPSVVMRRVGTMNVVTCATPSYLTKYGRPLHPMDLKKHTCLNYFSMRTGQVFDWEFTRNGERILLPVDSPLTLNDSNAYVDACVAGLGIGRLPTYMFRQYPSCGMLELVLCDWLSDDIPFHVVYPSNRHLSSKVRVFVDWVAEILEHHTGMQMCAQAKAARDKPPHRQLLELGVMSSPV